MEAGQQGDVLQSPTFIHFIIGHYGDALLPHHTNVGPVTVASPEEHRQQYGLSNGAPQHTQHHPVGGAVKLQTGKAHHLCQTKEKKSCFVFEVFFTGFQLDL